MSHATDQRMKNTPVVLYSPLMPDRERLRVLAGMSPLLTGREPGKRVYKEFLELLAKCRAEGLEIEDIEAFDDDDDCPLCLDMRMEHVFNKLTPGREHLSGVGF